MRVIEKEMRAAINRNLICNGGHWAKDNTSVYRRGNDGVDVFLHGHHIANVSLHGGGWSVAVNEETLKAWPTRTTMSRLRALGVIVNMKAGNVYLEGEELC